MVRFGQFVLTVIKMIVNNCYQIHVESCPLFFIGVIIVIIIIIIIAYTEIPTANMRTPALETGPSRYYGRPIRPSKTPRASLQYCTEGSEGALIIDEKFNLVEFLLQFRQSSD